MDSVEPQIFDNLVFAGSDPSDRTITLQLSNSEWSTRIDFTLGTVGPILAAINAEALKLNAGLSEEERLHSAKLAAKAVWLAMDSDQNPMIVFELANGSLLPLLMKNGDLAGLAAEMTLLSSRPPGEAH